MPGEGKMKAKRAQLAKTGRTETSRLLKRWSGLSGKENAFLQGSTNHGEALSSAFEPRGATGSGISGLLNRTASYCR